MNRYTLNIRGSMVLVSLSMLSDHMTLTCRFRGSGILCPFQVTPAAVSGVPASPPSALSIQSKVQIWLSELDYGNTGNVMHTQIPKKGFWLLYNPSGHGGYFGKLGFFAGGNRSRGWLWSHRPAILVAVHFSYGVRLSPTEPQVWETDSPVLNSPTSSPPPHYFTLEHDNTGELEISKEEEDDHDNYNDNDDESLEDDNSINEAEGYNSS